MSKESKTATLRSLSEQFSEGGLSISSDLFTSLANRIEIALVPTQDFDVDAERFKMLVNSLSDMSMALAKVEALARGMELTISWPDEDTPDA